uniref:Uncharacterized protein n=1 Tax=Anopheles christyi TaxID=43041 RepID=A0A182JS46_9DIPT
MQLIRNALRFSGTISLTSKNCSKRSWYTFQSSQFTINSGIVPINCPAAMIVIALWRVAQEKGLDVTLQFVANVAIALGLVEYREPPDVGRG